MAKHQPKLPFDPETFRTNTYEDQQQQLVDYATWLASQDRNGLLIEIAKWRAECWLNLYFGEDRERELCDVIAGVKEALDAGEGHLRIGEVWEYQHDDRRQSQDDLVSELVAALAVDQNR